MRWLLLPLAALAAACTDAQLAGVHDAMLRSGLGGTTPYYTTLGQPTVRCVPLRDGSVVCGR